MQAGPLIVTPGLERVKPRTAPTAPPLADLLHDLARRVLRLNPDRQNPETFLIAKDEIAAEMRRVARRVGAVR